MPFFLINSCFSGIYHSYIIETDLSLSQNPRFSMLSLSHLSPPPGMELFEEALQKWEQALNIRHRTHSNASKSSTSLALEGAVACPNLPTVCHRTIALSTVRYTFIYPLFNQVSPIEIGLYILTMLNNPLLECLNPCSSPPPQQTTSHCHSLLACSPLHCCAVLSTLITSWTPELKPISALCH